MTRTKVVYPGGFVRTTLLSQKFAVGDPRCWFCLRATAGPWWFHMKTSRVVCSTCLPDPWKDHTPKQRDSFYMGQVVAARLAVMERPGVPA